MRGWKERVKPCHGAEQGSTKALDEDAEKGKDEDTRDIEEKHGVQVEEHK